MSNQRLALRSELKLEDTWDLTQIFADEATYQSAFEALGTSLEKLESYRGRILESAETLYDFLELSEVYGNQFMKLYTYAHLAADVDVADSKNAARQGIILQRYAEFSARLSFVEPELMGLEIDRLDAMIASKPELGLYRHALETRLREKPHILSEAEERILSKLSPILDAPSRIFSKLSDADLRFEPTLDSEGEEQLVSEGRYSVLMSSPDRKLRAGAFKNIMAAYHSHRNAFAETLFAQFNYDNIRAEIKRFTSAREAALFSTQIPEAVYDQLLETVHENLALLHRYVAYRKKKLKLDELHYYDLFVSLSDEVKDLHFSFEEAKEIVFEALKPLGEDYRAMLERAFNERWIDIPENQGKRTGAYSSGCNGTPAYILLNWNGSLDALYTLIHELGHSMHSWHTWNSQAPVYANYGIFLAEIASTTNENLLTHYLLKKYADDPKMTAYLLNHYLDGARGTVFRQTQFADFEWQAHVKIQNGEAMTADDFDTLYGDLTYEYYGEALVRDPEPAHEWARIPHFYYNFYVFQYATGFSAATYFAETITVGEAGALDRYLGFLRAGESMAPMDVLKQAGIDMTKKDAVETCLKRFGEYLDRLESLDV
ncbi:MAG: oligoendopeptidase F [Eubacteriales bacterium]|nr:oligoendopeptidase F [Eubacteriales bacterium]